MNRKNPYAVSIQGEDDSNDESESLKKKIKYDTETQGDEVQPSGIGAVVAAHYNTLKEKGLEERKSSRIFYLRNFNNWIKSMLIKDAVNKLLENQETRYYLNVLDMGCGKGGDLLKWQKSSVKYLICADIAETSIEQCRSRYEDLKNRTRSSFLFNCEFITADCTKERLRMKFKDVTKKLDLVSCQFSFHYSFESLQQAEMMLRNASECLRPGGLFIGTIPDSAEIIRRVRKSKSQKFENDLFKIEICCKEPYPLFAAKYHFYLEGVVDCPEFLVYFPVLEKLAKKFGLNLVKREKFADFYEKKKVGGNFLLERMNSLEQYPPNEDVDLVAKLQDYLHAEEYIAKNNFKGKLGTISKSEWEAISLYQIFVFEKVDVQWDADGKPEYKL